MSQAAELNEMSMVILDWIREMDSEPGDTLRSVTEQHGYDGDVQKIGEAVHMSFMSLNSLFLPVAPNFLRMVFEDCVKQIDWVGVARQRMAETEDE
jgi:hypothetical protein